MQIIEEIRLGPTDEKMITVVKATELADSGKEVRYIEVPARLSNNSVFYRKDKEIKIEFLATP